MNILAIHTRTHDTSVAFISNGKILYAAANERFSRIKMDRNAPLLALKNFFSYTKIKPKDIDILVFVEDPLPKALWFNFKENSWPVLSTSGKYLLWLRNPILSIAELMIWTGLPSYYFRFYIPRIKINRMLKGFSGNVMFDHHHSAHMHAAYYTSGWDECLVLANEGSGFTETVSIHHVKNGVWEKVIENKLPNSMGKFYEIITELLGFDRHRHPGKITGLSAYGDPKKAYKFTKDLMWVKNDKVFLNHKKYLKLLAYYLNHKKLPKELSRFKREDLAAAFQKRLEDCLVDLIMYAVRQTGVKKIALAGGVAANVKANQKIHEIPEIEEIHVHQAMGDDGLALGAALHISSLQDKRVKQPDNIYFGPDFTNNQIEKSLKKYKLTYKKVTNIERKVAELISHKKIIARFDGRMEYGPRALGNRSILYHTQDATANNWLNKRLKRTEFMPFAPVTLSEYAQKCYVGLKGAEYSSRFMTITFQCTNYMKKTSPAVVHVDGTARPQILRRQDNPKYYKILKEYHKITGIPSIVNTSFNMHEEPIVCTPDDAIRSFLSSGVDYLSIGSFLVSLEDNEENAMEFRRKLDEQKKKNTLGDFFKFLRH